MSNRDLIRRTKQVRQDAVVLLDVVSRLEQTANSRGSDKAFYFELLQKIVSILAEVSDRVEKLEPGESSDVEYMNWNLKEVL